MPREDMPDIIVLLPGISGSRLVKDGKVIWGFSASAVMRALISGGGAIEKALTLADDPLDADDLGDGVDADALIPDLHMIPGLWKIDGYSRIWETLKASFAVTEGENLFAFPYDWRRDNRVAARRLAKSCHGWLKAWRQKSGNADAKLIFVAHSMGGLVARHFIECQEGWKDTRALITFGTPYRGSLNALDTLSNGMKEGPFGMIDVSRAARSFTAIYQLLPIYPTYDSGIGPLLRVGEALDIPNVDPVRAAQALAFHHEITDAAEANAKLADYEASGFRTIPFVGVFQTTNQSARLRNGKVELVTSHAGKDRGGDGTVPRVSAEPIGHVAGSSSAFFATRHGSLQNADAALVNLRGLINSFYLDLGPFKGARETPPDEVVQVDLDVPDLATSAEDVHVTARPSNPDVTLQVSIAPAAGGAATSLPMVPAQDGSFLAILPKLAAGDYSLSIDSETHKVERAADSLAVIDLDAP